MNKLWYNTITVLICAVLVVSCSKKTEQNVLTIAASPEPHAVLLREVAAELAKQGITLNVTEFTDYIMPNEAVESGEQLANFFQHEPYMESFNIDRGFHLVNAGTIHIEAFALYSKKHQSVDAFKEGLSIAIPNDPTNEARALLLLESYELIKIGGNNKLRATPLDIIENPYNLQFVEVEAASLPRVLADVDGAVINGNYAIPAGLSARTDGLIVEGKDSPYANVIAVKKGNEDDPRIKALIKALQSEAIRTFIMQKYPNGEVMPAF